MSCETYETLLNFLDVWLITGSNRSFRKEIQKFPKELIVEMEAFVDGALSEDSTCGCTFEKMVYLNYGIDYIMSALYMGTLPHFIASEARLFFENSHSSLSERVYEELAAMPISTFKSPVYCDSFTATKGATSSGEDTYMARDFQLPTGLVYQDIAADVIYVPTDGRLSHISSGIPGFIGRVTVMNEKGVSMGVDIVRAAPNTPETPGLNSILLLRKVADYATDVQTGVDIVASAERGCTWLYYLTDASGEGVIIEAGKYTPKEEPFDPLKYVDSEDLKKYLPTSEYFKAHSSDAIFDRFVSHFLLIRGMILTLYVGEFMLARSIGITRRNT